MRIPFRTFLLFAFCFCALAPALRAQSETDAWLRYAPLDASAKSQFQDFPGTVAVLGDSEILRSAKSELIRGVRVMLGKHLQAVSKLPQGRAIVLGPLADVLAALPSLAIQQQLVADGYLLETIERDGSNTIVITARDDRGVLYGTFALLRKIALGQPLDELHELQNPYAPIRWVDQWDNLDGTIERGYGGPSIFFENGAVRADLTRASEFARLLASLGINGCAINNVNADPRILSPDFLQQLARVAAAFRPWGVRLGVAVDFGSPKKMGGLATFDPLDAKVIAWWKAKADEIYRAIPDFGGFVVKADSEGRVGPSSYGRTQADAANVIARALEPHGGLLFYRAFVYDHHLDWRNPKSDRARAAYDIFHPLDGSFDANVILQIKNGPIDFQVREPASPLFGGLHKTSQVIELQITQEYTGQARHLCFLAPMWKATLDFDMHTPQDATPVKALVAGKAFDRPVGGFLGVANVGLDDNWAGS
ncbi:MAG TPA: alpha-glucuronidase family glycosyl hydrolase, partial [Candidatus Acidoferrales bacterium]|nr:alpha-glucuronidase family glycosyl hydrolase [Candidatus Acidoferrales bacterium]